jgi:hypothetical protein
MPPFAPQFVRSFIELGFGTEIIYSFVIIVCSLMIYFGTKEIYELSSYKGIKYFRQAFLFFAIAYFFRSFIKFILLYFNASQILDIRHYASGFIFSQLTVGFFMYFSAMAIFYLLYSVMYKKWNGDSKKIYFFHALAFVIALINMIFGSSLVYFGINFLLLIFVILTFFISRKQSKRKNSKHNLHVIYTLLFSFWILNIIDILIPSFFRTFQLLIYLASLGIFFVMVYKVLKRTGSS